MADILTSLWELRKEHRAMALANIEWTCGPARNFKLIAPQPHSDQDMKAVRELIAEAESRGLGTLDLLDIGGGFPIGYRREPIPIGQFCRPIRLALKQLPRSVRVIAEPGRFIAGPAGTALSRVVGRAQREGRWWYYLDDGMYGSYSGQLYDHATYPIDVPERDGPQHPSVLAGPTCDSIDVVREDLPLPELQIGDLVVGRMMGAYTCATATDFNFIPRARVVPLHAHAKVKK